MKYLHLILLSILILTACSSQQDSSVLENANEENKPYLQASILSAPESGNLEGRYKQIDELLVDLDAELSQPNIKIDDIKRGFYFGLESDKKYGTPDSWIWKEDGKKSKWMSPNSIEEEEFIGEDYLCKQTAGNYKLSCLETADAECGYIGESYCKCPEGTKWNEEQGCLLTNKRGSFVALRNDELAQGYYLGFMDQKKYGTPDDWTWVEDGRQSKWEKLK